MKRVISDFERDWPLLTNVVRDRWEKKPKPFIVSFKASPKSHEQLGYLHKIVLPILTVCLFECGEIKRSEERDAKYWLKRSMGYGDFISFNGGVVFDPDTFEKAKVTDLVLAIDTAINEADQRGYYIPPPKKN